MPTFSLENELDVMTATAWAEGRGTGRGGMEDICDVIMERNAKAWDKGGVLGVCLAPLQFSCWNENDPNRAAIFVTAKLNNPPFTWKIARVVAGVALAGHGPRRTGDADSYYALSMKEPPYWARSPAKHIYSNGWHSFWLTRTPPHAPVISVNSNVTADDLNTTELSNIGGGS